jgi:hypothetical protein
MIPPDEFPNANEYPITKNEMNAKHMIIMFFLTTKF